jgi:hypothetical protein
LAAGSIAAGTKSGASPCNLVSAVAGVGNAVVANGGRRFCPSTLASLGGRAPLLLFLDGLFAEVDVVAPSAATAIGNV